MAKRTVGYSVWLVVILLLVHVILCQRYPPVELEHRTFVSPEFPILPREVNGSELREWNETPDFRLEEPPWEAYKAWFYKEEQRPYRISPFFKQIIERYQRVHAFLIQSANIERPENLGCYCTTVYKRLTLLAGCAIITTRHLLTTASATEMVLKGKRQWHNLTDILGAWYETNINTFNASMYMTPARIHYHPGYLTPEQVNISHPLPFKHDLSVWAATYRFYGYFLSGTYALVCPRGGPHGWEYASSTPRSGELAHIIGYQFVKSIKRKPMPWFKFMVRSRRHVDPCPKTEWGWYHCIEGAYFSRFGLDSGASWSRALEGRRWVYDGLIGMHAFTMHLRSDWHIHYFIVLNTHPVLDWLYNSYMGRLPYQYLDSRYYDSQWKAPIPRPGWRIDWLYPLGKEEFYGFDLPFF